MLGRAEHAQARDGVVARQDHHLHARRPAAVEAEQLVHQRERHAGPRRLLQARQLQLHVGAIVGGLEDAVLLLEVEQRARRDGDDELAFERGGHA